MVSVVASDGFRQATGAAGSFFEYFRTWRRVCTHGITGKNVSLHPALVLGAILVGGKVGGVLGMTLAVPVAAVIKVILVETVVNLRRFHF